MLNVFMNIKSFVYSFKVICFLFKRVNFKCLELVNMLFVMSIIWCKMKINMLESV